MTLTLAIIILTASSLGALGALVLAIQRHRELRRMWGQLQKGRDE